jgi:2-haloacid dehalogenase
MLPVPTTSPAPIQALLFDTFGTVVDWQPYLAQKVTETAARHHIVLNANAANGFVKKWRAAYIASLAPVREGKRPFVTLDVLLPEILDALLAQTKLEVFTADERAALVNAWHTLPPWPDTVKGLTRLKSKFIIGTLSNGSTRILTDMAKNGGLPWDVIFAGDTFHHYKPDAETYLGAAALLNAPPSAVMMVAAHNSDLAAARSHGLRTAFIERSTEDQNHADWDYVASGIDDLAAQLRT